jgi:hypothetical protein
MDCGRMIVTCVLAATLLAACGSDDSDSPGVASDSSPTSSSAPSSSGPSSSTSREMSRVPPPTARPPSRPPARPTDRVSPVTVRGRLTRPTPDCLVVDAENGPWALVGDLPTDITTLAAGTEVEATGRPAPEADAGAGAACGYPTLRVSSIRAV